MRNVFWCDSSAVCLAPGWLWQNLCHNATANRIQSMKKPNPNFIQLYPFASRNFQALTKNWVIYGDITYFRGFFPRLLTRACTQCNLLATRVDLCWAVSRWWGECVLFCGFTIQAQGCPTNFKVVGAEISTGSGCHAIAGLLGSGRCWCVGCPWDADYESLYHLGEYAGVSHDLF